MPCSVVRDSGENLYTVLYNRLSLGKDDRKTHHSEKGGARSHGLDGTGSTNLSLSIHEMLRRCHGSITVMLS